MTPAQLLSLVITLSAAATVCERILRRMHRRRLQKIADRWGMNYSPIDQFRLTPRIARNFPVPGAATIRVVDLIYGIDEDMYRYVFTAEYTAGVVTGKHRVLRVARLSEPRDRAGQPIHSDIVLARGNVPLLEQYHEFAPPPVAVSPTEI